MVSCKNVPAQSSIHNICPDVFLREKYNVNVMYCIFHKKTALNRANQLKSKREMMKRNTSSLDTFKGISDRPPSPILPKYRIIETLRDLMSVSFYCHQHFDHFFENYMIYSPLPTFRQNSLEI